MPDGEPIGLEQEHPHTASRLALVNAGLVPVAEKVVVAVDRVVPAFVSSRSVAIVGVCLSSLYAGRSERKVFEATF